MDGEALFVVLDQRVLGEPVEGPRLAAAVHHVEHQQMGIALEAVEDVLRERPPLAYGHLFRPVFLHQFL